METRRLGKTGHMSSIIVFGGFAVGWVNQKEADAAIDMAVENGINHIDVSPIYGEAEVRIGSWNQRHGNHFFLACKTHEREKAGAWESLQRSLDNLKVDHFDLFQFHGVDNVETLDRVLGSGGALEAVLEAKSQDLVRNIGITGHNPVTQNEALEARHMHHSTPVDQAMSHALLCLESDIPLHRAAAQAAEMEVRRIVAVKGRKMEGILTGIDLARAAA